MSEKSKKYFRPGAWRAAMSTFLIIFFGASTDATKSDVHEQIQGPAKKEVQGSIPATLVGHFMVRLVSRQLMVLCLFGFSGNAATVNLIKV